MEVTSKLQEAWRGRGLLSTLLLPLAWTFAIAAAFRRTLYRLRILKVQQLPATVIVIGNITVGGSGKTPLTLLLAREFQQRGRHPGIISRGHGGAVCFGQVREVLVDSQVEEVGDEPLMLKRRSGLPVFVGHDRVAVARALLTGYPECNLILSDDGLQHYRLARDVEIAVVDGRGLMNGRLLPAGPLREFPRRLRHVDALVHNGPVEFRVPGVATFRMDLCGDTFYSLADPARTCSAAALMDLQLAAVAGIGVPGRFFDHLARLGLNFSAHAFPDHHRYLAGDLSSIRADAFLMTEKDAVKCSGVTERPVWILPVTAKVSGEQAGSDLLTHVEKCIVEKPNGRPPA